MLHNPLGFYLVVWIGESALLLHALVNEVQQNNFLNHFNPLKRSMLFKTVYL